MEINHLIFNFPAEFYVEKLSKRVAGAEQHESPKNTESQLFF